MGAGRNRERKETKQHNASHYHAGLCLPPVSKEKSKALNWCDHYLESSQKRTVPWGSAQRWERRTHLSVWFPFTSHFSIWESSQELIPLNLHFALSGPLIATPQTISQCPQWSISSHSESCRVRSSHSIKTPKRFA